MSDKAKLSDAVMLQMEKKRLSEICLAEEEKIKILIGEFRERPVHTMLQTIFTSDSSEPKNKITQLFQVLGLVALPLAFRFMTRRNDSHVRTNLLRLSQSVLVALAVRLFRKKKKQSREEGEG